VALDELVGQLVELTCTPATVEGCWGEPGLVPDPPHAASAATATSAAPS